MFRAGDEKILKWFAKATFIAFAVLALVWVISIWRWTRG
jgi:hypothetical protein